MKKLVFFLYLSILLVSCGQQSPKVNPDAENSDSLALVESERRRTALPQSLNKSDTDGLYEAKIDKDGEVDVTFNYRACSRFAKKLGLPLMVSELSIVKGLNPLISRLSTITLIFMENHLQLIWMTTSFNTH